MRQVTTLWGVFEVNYARLEARHPTLDLLTMPLRKALNLAYEFLVDCVHGSDDWDRVYAPIFDPDAHEESKLNLGYFGGAQALQNQGIGDE